MNTLRRSIEGDEDRPTDEDEITKILQEEREEILSMMDNVLNNRRWNRSPPKQSLEGRINEAASRGGNRNVPTLVIPPMGAAGSPTKTGIGSLDDDLSRKMNAIAGQNPNNGSEMINFGTMPPPPG